MSLMITEIDLEPSLGEMVEALEEEMVEEVEVSKTETVEVIKEKEVLEVTEVVVKVSGMVETQVGIREIIVEEEIVGEAALETSNMEETLGTRSKNR